MTRLRIFLHRLLGLFLKRKLERELEDEIRSHLEMQIEDNLRQGMSLEEAQRAARLKFGGVAQVKEAYRDKSRLRWIEDLWQDLRYGARLLLKQPGFTAIAIITLALGIGANTAIFSVANTILLQPLPIKDADRIFDVHSYVPHESKRSGFSYPDYLELRKRTGEVVNLFAWSRVEPVLGASGVGSKAMVESEGEELRGLLVAGTYFSALGGQALLGRTLMPEDDQAAGAHPVVVLSHGFWQRRFGAAPDIVGQTILLNGRAFTVVGVAEASFTGVGRAPDVWLPLLMRDQLNAESHQLGVMGRLQPGVSRRQAEAALAMAFSQLQQDRLGPLERGAQIKLYPVSLLPLEERQAITTVASVALGAVTLVLLIACLNVAGLTLARLAARQREIAVRLSLGASRGRLLRQLFTESLLLAGAGGLAGLLLSRWMAQALSILLHLDESALRGVALDWRVMAYTLGISVFTAVVVGLLPAWQTTHFNLVPALKQEAAGFNLRARRFPLRSMLVVGQIALSLVLLLGAGLFARTLLHMTLLHMMTIEPGFETKNLSLVEFQFRAPGSPRYDETRAAQFQRDLQERLLATPMVKDVVWVGRIPLPEPADDSRNFRYWLEGRAIIVNGGMAILNDDPGNFAASNVVSPNYFAAFGVPLLYGRTFTEQETRDEAAVVVINEALARRHWPGDNPVGKSLLTGRKWEIIGVTRDTQNTLLNVANEPYLYLPLPLKERLGLRLFVRSDAAPGALAATLRTTIRSLDPKLKINVRQFSDLLKGMFRPLLLGTSLASLFGVLALALAVMGLYGVTAFAVVQRTHEIGVRMALGARSADVVRLVLRQGLRMVIIGVAIGLLISAVATRVLAAVLFGISPTDPLTFGVITLLLGLVALLACWFPARRATKVDPIIALRCE
ncbi:MAG: ABC transporter permease [Acidobacteria bacterium]|nr:ABC transporter permease [Acidobacteriota bacterium]